MTERIDREGNVVLFPSRDINYTSGSTWTQGATGHVSGALTFQADGNLVIHPQAAHTAGTAP